MSSLNITLHETDCDPYLIVSEHGLSAQAPDARMWWHQRMGARATHTAERGIFEMTFLDAHEVRENHKNTVTVRIGVSYHEGQLKELGLHPGTWAYGSSGSYYDDGKAFYQNRGSTVPQFKSGQTVAVAFSREFIKFYKEGGMVKCIERKASEQGKLLWPHVNFKNAKVKVNFHKVTSRFPDAYDPDLRFLGDYSLQVRIPNPVLAPRSFEQSMVIMMVGLPGSGKTHIVEYLRKQIPDVTVLSTNDLVDSAKIGGREKHNYAARWDVHYHDASRIFNATLESIRSSAPRHYIIDQTNCYAAARHVKMEHFEQFGRRVCLVCLPPADQWQKQLDLAVEKDKGKYLPLDVFIQPSSSKDPGFLSHFNLPESANGMFTDIHYVGCEPNEAQSRLDDYHRVLNTGRLYSGEPQARSKHKKGKGKGAKGKGKGKGKRGNKASTYEDARDRSTWARASDVTFNVNLATLIDGVHQRCLPYFEPPSASNPTLLHDESVPPISGLQGARRGVAGYLNHAADLKAEAKPEKFFSKVLRKPEPVLPAANGTLWVRDRSLVTHCAKVPLDKAAELLECVKALEDKDVSAIYYPLRTTPDEEYSRNGTAMFALSTQREENFAIETLAGFCSRMEETVGESSKTMKAITGEAASRMRLQREMHKAFCEILDPLTLAIPEEDNLWERGLSRQQALDCGLKSWKGGCMELPTLRVGDEFGKKSRIEKVRVFADKGLLIPARNAEGLIWGIQSKPRIDDTVDPVPDEELAKKKKKTPKYKWLSCNKSIKIGDDLPFFCCCFDWSTKERTVALIEGGLKAYIFALLAKRMPVIGGSGGQWDQCGDALLHALARLVARRVLLFADAGAVQNHCVLLGYFRSISLLMVKWGIPVRVVWWEQESKETDLDADDLFNNLRNGKADCKSIEAVSLSVKDFWGKVPADVQDILLKNKKAQPVLAELGMLG